MPRLSEATKDVVSCEKLRGSAHTNWSADVRMGQPGMLKTCHPDLSGSKPGELKHLSTRRKRNRRDSVSSGERKRISPKVFIYLEECSGKNSHRGWWPRNRKAYIDDKWVGRDTWNPVWIWGDHPPRLNTPERPIVNKYCEGKVKSTSNRRVK